MLLVIAVVLAIVTRISGKIGGVGCMTFASHLLVPSEITSRFCPWAFNWNVPVEPFILSVPAQLTTTGQEVPSTLKIDSTCPFKALAESMVMVVVVVTAEAEITVSVDVAV